MCPLQSTNRPSDWMDRPSIANKMCPASLVTHSNSDNERHNSETVPSTSPAIITLFGLLHFVGRFIGRHRPHTSGGRYFTSFAYHRLTISGWILSSYELSRPIGNRGHHTQIGMYAGNRFLKSLGIPIVIIIIIFGSVRWKVFVTNVILFKLPTRHVYLVLPTLSIMLIRTMSIRFRFLIQTISSNWLFRWPIISLGIYSFNHINPEGATSIDRFWLKQITI